MPDTTAPPVGGDPPIRATITRSDTTFTVDVASAPTMGGMTVRLLRDFLRATDQAGIPDDARLTDRHAGEYDRFVGMIVRHTFTVEEADHG